MPSCCKWNLTSHVAHCRKDRDTLRLTQSVIDNVSEAGPLPFELRVLEALLDETARQFERRQRRLELLANSIEDDIHKQLQQHSADLQRLLPVQRSAGATSAHFEGTPGS